MHASSAQPYSQPSSSQPPSMVTSSARPLQLDQWANTKAPLTSSQRASVNRLAEWLHRNSSDFKQQQRQQQSTQPTTSQQAVSENTTAIEDGRETTLKTVDSKNGQPSTSSSEPIALPDAGAPLVSAQSFLAWYTQLSDSVTSSTQTSHLKALQRISDTTSTADNLLAQLEACQVNVSELRAGTAFVQDSSRGIREQAQALLDSQNHLDTLAEDVASRLSFFTLLPYATNMLSSPDSTIVYSQTFLELMDQLEMALLFLQQEPARSYRDAALYRMRYSQCVTRAATLAKMAVVRDIKSEAERTAERVKQLESNRNVTDAKTSFITPTSDVKGKARELSDDNMDDQQPALANDTAAALFGDEAHQVTKLRPLIFELQKRASNTTASTTPSASTAAEFESLLQECRTAWYQYRRPLLSRILLQRITEIEIQAASSQGSNGALHSIVQLARGGTDLLRSVLQSEFELYQQFFGRDTAIDSTTAEATTQDKEMDAGLSTYLSELSETVTARLRPKLSKEEDLLVLAQTSSAIADAVHSTNSGESTWTRSLLPLLNETQNRLIARAQTIISTDITHFTPSEEDGELDYPERIQRYKSSSANALSSPAGAGAGAGAGKQHRRGKSGAGLLDAALSASHAASSSKAQQEKVQLFSLPPALNSTYYAPVGYMLELLYHLQARVPASAFRKVAMAAVDACLISVGKGSLALMKRKRGQSLEREDGWLFELRHLEILREAVMSAELVLKQDADTNDARLQGSLDVGSGKGSLVDLSSLVTAINSLWTNTGRLLYPSSSSTTMNTTNSIDPSHQLDMNPCTTAITTKLQTLINELSTLWFNTIVLPLRVYIDQSSAEASVLKWKSTYDAFDTCIESVIPEKAEKVGLWIEDQEVQRMLVREVTEKVMELYGQFVDLKPEGLEGGEIVVDAKVMQERVMEAWGKVLGL
ncbi:related to conserved oligomeric Golgi complex component 3 [Ustilago trichophora]|uniref:Conserved oligomeric Golgi complex subunit 3 n=1 Tax=Ustilago trichophora TaxID=86804 RepID=A0A5C3EJX3_9BASI|nr:related to conserved oligomeric Golgi complex component 3 [Ustilago trichophora]